MASTIRAILDTINEEDEKVLSEMSDERPGAVVLAGQEEIGRAHV